MDNETIIRDVDRFLKETKMAESTLGKKAVNDGKAIRRLRSGKRMWPETITKLRDFMEARERVPESARPSPAPSPSEAA